MSIISSSKARSQRKQLDQLDQLNQSDAGVTDLGSTTVSVHGCNCASAPGISRTKSGEREKRHDRWCDESDGNQQQPFTAPACALRSPPWISSPLSPGGLRSGPGSVSTCRASSGLWEPAGSSGTAPFSSPRAPSSLDLDQRLRLDPSHGSPEFYTRVTDGVIRPEGALTLPSRHHSVKRKHKPYQTIRISTHGCSLVLACQILFYDCGLFHFSPQRASFVRLASALSLTLAQWGCRLGKTELCQHSHGWNPWLAQTRASGSTHSLIQSRICCKESLREESRSCYYYSKRCIMTLKEKINTNPCLDLNTPWKESTESLISLTSARLQMFQTSLCALSPFQEHQAAAAHGSCVNSPEQLTVPFIEETPQEQGGAPAAVLRSWRGPRKARWRADYWRRQVKINQGLSDDSATGGQINLNHFLVARFLPTFYLHNQMQTRVNPRNQTHICVVITCQAITAPFTNKPLRAQPTRFALELSLLVFQCRFCSVNLAQLVRQ